MHGTQDRYGLEMDAEGAGRAAGIPAPETVEHKRAVAFSQILRTLLQRRNYYAPMTAMYLLPEFYERLQAVGGLGINVNTLRAYLLGEMFPSPRKVRLIADALELPRSVLLFAAGYLGPEDLPDYPSPQTSLGATESDIGELEHVPLSTEAKSRILHDLQNTARILRLLNGEGVQADWHVEPDEREQLIEQMIDLWESPAPMPLDPSFSWQSEDEILKRRPEPIGSTDRDGSRRNARSDGQ
ncbi:MAG: hypothetical protein ACLQUY_13005 [Ktedonobacterales bacterium]